MQETKHAEKELIKNTLFFDEGNKVLVIHLWTWGSCKGSGVFIVDEKKSIDMRELCNKSGTKELEWGTIECIVNDTRKHINRYVEISLSNLKRDIVMYFDVALSCKYSIRRAYRVFSDEIRELELREEIEKIENEDTIMTFSVLYAIDEKDVNKYVIKREFVEKIKKKLKIFVKHENGIYHVFGDTYEIREMLKLRNYKWNNIDKVWYGTTDPRTFLSLSNVELIFT